MTLFCDTSALIKLYVREPFTEEMLAAADAARALAVCRIAWAEAIAALARRLRESPADAAVIDSVRERLRNDWSDYLIVEVTQALVALAGDYADTFALRGYDKRPAVAAQTLSASLQAPVRSSRPTKVLHLGRAALLIAGNLPLLLGAPQAEHITAENR
ncbi:type II toxin-antitoxin system VapC family toxin [Lamprobacter modestohalophilus]|uniref:type II toxin-antitoxin system VapC family toxin n=1 Tax=Lamprobacter modestohalophilus TaxID=1064514 RepID=UPI002ADEB5B0|nr:type II toxin-antitoxin system VapC family toxin [Lamprobacter modestohalophilus]MEA1051752.1 type II toxin-antitoxin system VapC family toxin [Lamprobacter modestohalophilus]